MAKNNYAFDSNDYGLNSNFGMGWGTPSKTTTNAFNLDPMSQGFGDYGSAANSGGYSFASPVAGSYPMNNTGLTGGGGGGGRSFGGMFDSTDADGIKTQGWGGLALGAASVLSNLSTASKQYRLAKDTLKFNKGMFAKNFEAKKRTTNASLRDRQSARVASNPGAYQSVGSYMDQNGIQ